MTKFETLQSHNYDLLVRLDQQPGEIKVDEIEAFIEQVKEEASQVIDPLDRDQLRAIVRFWASHIFDKTGKYPDTTLQPADPAKSAEYIQTKTAARVPAWVLVLVATLVIIALIYGISTMTSWITANRTVALQETKTAEEAATQVYLESGLTALAMGWTSTPTGTSMPLTPTTTPTATPTPPTETLTPTLTTRPDAGIQLLVQNLANANQVLPQTTLSGTYDGLAPGSSIHILLQPINQCGLNNILVEDYFIVTEPSGKWEIPVTFGKDDTILTEEQYNIRLYFAQNQAVRDILAKERERFSTCFNAADLPTGFYPYQPLVLNVSRPKYEARLVFSSRDPKSNFYDIATTRLDGSDFRLLTDTPKIDEQEPHVCKWNQKIVYVDKSPIQGAQNQIWTMDLNGSNPEKLVAEPGVQYERPFWSPDCQFITYGRLKLEEKEQWQIEVIEYEYREQGPALLGQGRYPVWMPEGHNLVFNHLIINRINYPSFALVDLDNCTLEPGGKEADCFMDTTRFKYLGTPPAQGLQPAVSPDGRQLAFITYVQMQGDKTYQHIRGFHLDGSGPVYDITTAAGLYTDWYPTWGPDLENPRVYFQSWRRENTNIWAIGADGSNLTPIGPSQRINIFVTWQLLALPGLGQ